MKETGDCKPNVLCFSGLDPTGGAGIQADIEALFSAGCHCLPVVTALTVQDTHNVRASHPVAPTLLIAQARAVLDDMPVAAIKIGLLGSIQAAEAIHSILRDHPDIPVILDPILRAGGGFDFSADDIRSAMRNFLIPLTTILTTQHTGIATAHRCDKRPRGQRQGIAGAGLPTRPADWHACRKPQRHQ
jgi:hydroxymethylpyrimidine/phosphomethylpyrimidine kinase